MKKRLSAPTAAMLHMGRREPSRYHPVSGIFCLHLSMPDNGGKPSGIGRFSQRRELRFAFRTILSAGGMVLFGGAGRAFLWV